MLIRIVWKNKTSGQLRITLPKDEKSRDYIGEGDYVKITKIENEDKL